MTSCRTPDLRRPCHAWRLVALTCGLMGVAALVHADPQGRQLRGEPVAVPRAELSQPDPMQEVTPEREAAAETFARLHHSELANLLTRLKKAAPAEYENAVRELFRESERLAKLKSRDPARYELELQNWKIASRIRLVSARLTMSDSDSLRAELVELVTARQAVRQELLQLERSKLAARLSKIDSDLNALQTDGDKLIAQDVERLIKAARSRGAATRNPAGRSSGNRAPAARPATPSDTEAAATESPQGLPSVSSAAPAHPQ